MTNFLSLNIHKDIAAEKERIRLFGKDYNKPSKLFGDTAFLSNKRTKFGECFIPHGAEPGLLGTYGCHDDGLSAQRTFGFGLMSGTHTAEKMLEEILEMVRVKKVTVDNNTVSFDYQYLPVEERGRQRRKRKYDGQPISKVYVETRKVTLDEKITVERVGRKGEFSYPPEWYFRVRETNKGFKAPTRDVVLAYEFWLENRDVHDCNIPKKYRKDFEESSKWEVGNGGVGGEAADKEDEEENGDAEQSCGVPANQKGVSFKRVPRLVCGGVWTLRSISRIGSRMVGVVKDPRPDNVGGRGRRVPFGRRLCGGVKPLLWRTLHRVGFACDRQDLFMW